MFIKSFIENVLPRIGRCNLPNNIGFKSCQIVEDIINEVHRKIFIVVIWSKGFHPFADIRGGDD